jgi:hypothetical protein
MAGMVWSIGLILNYDGYMIQFCEVYPSVLGALNSVHCCCFMMFNILFILSCIVELGVVLLVPSVVDGKEPKSRHTSHHMAPSYWIMVENPAILAEIDHSGEPKSCHRYPPWHCHGRFLTTLLVPALV